MKVKNSFVLRHIGSKYLLVPLGEESKRFKGAIDINETTAFLWEKLKTEQTEESLCSALLQEYDVSEEQATSCVKSFTEYLKQYDFLA